MDELTPTGLIRYVWTRRNGDVERVIGVKKGSIDKDKPPHYVGNGVLVSGEDGGGIFAVVYTPHLAETWQVFVVE